ncbi:MAG: serine/threonine protein kinase [Deltaproteobacteria bacterium]|nr:serine/threonine protein kinase [Deltaproteobacteria bacterium]
MADAKADDGAEPAATVTVAPTKPNPTVAVTEGDVMPSVASTITLPPPGYALTHVIGRGGMGEVHAAQDRRIGREVAIKRMRSPNPTQDAIARFLREARIQARLDHPAIVPVHELGIDESGRPYFTMKRISGVTMARLLADGGTLHRLLRAFVDVCLVIDLAHKKAIVHRDLKPANIMLGDHGEVYVLDWGVARVLTDSPEVSTEPLSGSADDLSADPEDSTKSGALLGTPGYISPEQIQGNSASPPTDVYALGCILFEILAAEPLHPKGQAALGRTLSTPQASPAQRRPDRPIAPELDVVCFLALSDEPSERPSARELADRVQAYLDGDRDVERRQALAREQLAAAREALDSKAPDARALAMRRAGRALALDPESVDAAEMASALLLEPPKVMPPDLQQSLTDEERTLSRQRNRQAMWTYVSMFALLPVALALDVKSYVALFALYGTIALGAAFSWVHARRGRSSIAVVLTVNFLLAIMFSRIVSPFVLTPLMICGVLAAITANEWVGDRTGVVVGWTLLAVMGPLVLEWVGVLPQTWWIENGRMTIISDVFTSHGRREVAALAVANLAFAVMFGLMALVITRQRRIAQRALHVQAWHLRQLLPAVKPPPR